MNNASQNGDASKNPFEEEKFSDEEDKETTEEEDAPYDIPAKDRKLVTHPYDFIVRSLDDQIKDGTLILADKYQRRQVWKNVTCSRLIESLLMNVPIPVCYFAELETGQYSVIDGQQRLSAIHRYLNNEYPLSGLKVKHELINKRFHQLSQEDKRLILSRTIRCIVILRESHPDIRFDVFERLNTSSSQLSTQELRNCIYRGELNDLIRRLSEDHTFLYIRDVKEPDLRMKDNEMILRFFAFYEKLPTYRGHLKKFLDDYQRSGMKMDSSHIKDLETLFLRVINDVKLVFGKNAFRKYDSQNESWEGSVNRAIYDSVMICFANAESAEIIAKKDRIIDGLKGLCESNIEFQTATASATKDRAKVKSRIVQFRNMMIGSGITVNNIEFWDEI
jgi:uncharacterized protein with ParB-like and HNH nuclease domain